MFTIIFDLDGTLVDTAPDLIDTLNFTLRQHRLPTLPYEEARRLIGGGVRAMLEGAMVVEGRRASPADIDSLYGLFVAHYGEHIADRSRPFPGVEVELDRLVTAGYRLAVCTNKLEWLSKRLMDALELSDRFAAICGPDTFGVQSRTRGFCVQLSLASAESPRALSWSVIPSLTFAPRGPQACR